MKNIFSVLTLLFLYNLWALTPSSIAGVWKSPSRLIFFGDGVNNEDTDFSLAYALYYGWYYDFAVTSNTTNIEGVKKNSASSYFPQEFEVAFEQFESTGDYLNAYEVIIKDKNASKSFGGEVIKIPIAVIDDALYSDFYIKKSLDGDYFYESVNSVRGILMNGRVNKENIFCYYIHNEDTYKIRYWKSTMDKNTFSDGDNYANQYVTFKGDKGVFRVPKFIESCGVLYTCTTGRRKKVRNVQKCNTPDLSKCDKTGVIIAAGDNIAKKCSENTKEQMLSIIDKQNKMRKPNPPPLFIDEADENYYNKIIGDDLKDLENEIKLLETTINKK